MLIIIFAFFASFIIFAAATLQYNRRVLARGEHDTLYISLCLRLRHITNLDKWMTQCTRPRTTYHRRQNKKDATQNISQKSKI
jgi:hypothetical protein